MSTLIEDNIKSKPLFDLYNIEPNSLIALSFNFDQLKYVITELRNNQKNIYQELSAIKSEISQQKNDINRIKSDVTETELLSEKNKDIQKNFEEKKKKLNEDLIDLENRIKIKNLVFNNKNKEENNKNNEFKTKTSNLSYGENSEEMQTIINDIKDIKLKQSNLDKDFQEYRNDIEKHFSKKTNDYIPDIKNNFDSKIKILEASLIEEIKQNSRDIQNIKEELGKKSNETNQKISETETNNKFITELKEGYDVLLEKLNSLNSNFSSYTTIKYFNEGKSEILEYIKNIKEEINKNVELLRRGFNNLKTQLIEHISDRTDHNNIDVLFKRFDVAQNMIYNFRDFQLDMEERERKRIVINPNHFINKEAFDDFLKNDRKNVEEYKKECLTLKHDLEELKNKEMGNKATLKDLKLLEENIYQTIENFKQSISKKFVDKTTLHKNSKILEMQTKKIIQENQKEERKDNWLLTKRMGDGHLCASCEAFIGDLNQNITNKYIPWNKYPKKEQQEKAFKIEGGLSKIVNMVNMKSNIIKKRKYNKNIIKSNSLNNSISIIKINNEDNTEELINRSRNKSTENINNDNKLSQMSSFSNRLSIKNNHIIKNETEDFDSFNNFPIIPKKSQNIKKNNSSFDLFTSNININNKIISKTLKLNKIPNKKITNNLLLKNIQLEEEDIVLSSRINNLKTKQNEKEKKEEPIIIKIFKKH